MKNIELRRENSARDPIEIDPQLWDRLIWQQALEKAIKKNIDERNKDRNKT